MTEEEKVRLVNSLIQKPVSKDISNIYPSKIYKFISFGTDHELNRKKINCLKSNQICLSSPLNFNDPYDCQLSIDIMSNTGDILKLGLNREERRLAKKHKKKFQAELKTDFQNLQTDLVKEWNDFRRNMMVCCFTEAWDSFLMWAHYANSYQGICIEYNTIDMVRNKLFLLPVLYTEELLQAIQYLRKEDIQKDDPELFYRAGIYAVLSKHTSWKYEREWRLVEVNNSTTQSCQLRTTPTPSAIYIGPRISKDLKNEIIEISKELKIPTYDVVISDTEYNLSNQES
ncbi:MAG: DUF2971 domain-containing protein [Aminipila sp.]